MRYSYLGEHRIQRVLSYIAAVLAGIYLTLEHGGTGFRILGIALVIGGIGGLVAEFRARQNPSQKD